MRQELCRLLAVFVLATGSLLADPGWSQERDAFDRILNPLPDFDPFEKPPARPQFFPDQTDKQIRDLLVDTLTRRQDTLEDHLKFFKDQDQRLQKEHKTVTGLTDHVQDLVNNKITDREHYLAAQKDALRNAATPERKQYLESIINHDDLNQADQLTRQSRLNNWGGVLNRMLSSVDLVSVASGNYIGAAAETVISQLYALADKDMRMEERRALARDLAHLKRYPNDPRNREILKRIDASEKTKRGVLVRKQLEKAHAAKGKGDLDQALFHAQFASYLDPESRDAAKLLAELNQLTAETEKSKKSGLAVQPERKTPPAEADDARRLLQALSLRDVNQIERLAIDLGRKYRNQPLADAALDAEAVALEMRGRHEEAKKVLGDVARYSINADTKKRVSALLQSREYNLFGNFQNARSDRQLESMKYVLLGEDLLKKNLLFAAGAMAAAGPAGAVSLGFVNAVMMGQNLYKVTTNNPISAQPVIDAGVAYVRSHPSSSSATEIYKVLASAYEDKGMFEKALAYHELAGAPKEKIAAVKEKAASAYLNAAARTGDRNAREYFLTAAVDEAPGSVTAAEATRKLAELAKDDNRGLRMSKQFLMENPELFGPAGLGLKASLFDGNPRNMEIAERGVNLLGDNELLVHYQTPWGVRSQTYPLSRSASERFFVSLRQKNLDVAKADVNQRAKDSVGGIRNLPGSVVSGERDRRRERPEDNYDATFSLVREANGSVPNFDRVLDASMLSENELNPGGKYQLPPMQGSISASRFSLTGALPTGLGGNQLAVGSDSRGGFAGVRMPIPLLQGFIPVDFMVQGRPGGVSVFPRIQTGADRGADPELYR
ncbi:MAG: hypothetical protein FJ145_15200 [Deltaproteobacteria bacterium]|nr:hypothetical protein [Deltaproteobacteria bacterium]